VTDQGSKTTSDLARVQPLARNPFVPIVTVAFIVDEVFVALFRQDISRQDRDLPAQVLLNSSDFTVVKRTVTTPLSLIPGTLLLALILLAQKLIALFAP
jgi:hypothetical protein